MRLAKLVIAVDIISDLSNTLPFLTVGARVSAEATARFVTKNVPARRHGTPISKSAFRNRTKILTFAKKEKVRRIDLANALPFVHNN